MKHILYLFVASTLLSSCSTINLLNSQVKFAQISIADFFENDTISLKIADSLILDNVVVASEFSTGHTGWEVKLIKYNDDLFRINLFATRGGVRFIWCRQPVSKMLKVEAWLNGQHQAFKFNLNKGIYILIDKHKEGLSFQQTKMIPQFE